MVHRRRLLLLGGLAAAIAVLLFVSISVGSRGVAPGTVFRALFGHGTVDDVALVQGFRFPRTVAAVLVGVALGLAGALMQGLTRNPLADPLVLGVSSGAAFAVVLASGLLGISYAFGYVWFGFIGAALATAVVYGIGSVGRGGATPVKLALAGAALSAVLSSVTTAVLLLDPLTLDQYRLWSVGSLSQRSLGSLGQIAPFVLAGAVLAAMVTPSLNNLALGEDVARTLGLRVGLVRIQGAVAIILLAGGAVAAAGPIGFVGLVAPHIARAVVGPDQRWITASSALLAPVLMLSADVLGRLVAYPAEVPVGVVAAFLGAPVFIVLVRRRRVATL